MNIRNKKVYLEYEVIEKYIAGIELLGYEVKSIRNNKALIDGARIIVRGGEAYIVGMSVQPYQANNTNTSQKKNIHRTQGNNRTIDRNIDRTRKLLLKKSELIKLSSIDKSGLTLIPLSIFDKNNRIKLEFALARKLKKWDKRELLKKKDYKNAID